MRKRSAQSTFEFTILTVVVLGAMLTMSVYFKRGLQGKWRTSTDDIGEQYDPNATNGTIVYRLNSETEIRIITVPAGSGIWTMREDNTNMIETRSGTTTVATAP